VEAVILAGGRAERLGEVAGGRPKALVELGGRPLAAYQVEQLGRAGVDRVLVSCAGGQEGLFEAALGGIGPEVVAVPEPAPLGRGGGIRFAAQQRREAGDLFALNGDELVDVDLSRLLEHHREGDAAATITVVPLQSPFPVGQTPYFVIRNNDPAVDGFYISTDVDGPNSLPLAPGQYSASVDVSALRGHPIDAVDHAVWFDVIAADFYGNGKMPDSDWGQFVARSRWEVADAEEEAGIPSASMGAMT